MFIPTTIFDMVWGVRFLQEAHDMPYSLAVLRSASVPFGWIIGCPLLGWLTRPDRAPQAGDHRRRRWCCWAALALILYGPPDMFPPLQPRPRWPASRRARR